MKTPPQNGEQEQPVRLWLIAAAGSVLIACAVALLVHSSRPQPATPDPAPVAASRLTKGAMARGERDRALSALKAAPHADPMPLQGSAESADAEDNSSPQFDSVALSDPAFLRTSLSGGDAALADAVLQAASRHDQQLAGRILLNIITNGAEPKRLEVLQRLCASPYVDATTRTAALSAALQDSDNALVVQAVQELHNRTDATAIGLLSDAFNKGAPSTRLLILGAIASNSSDEPLLLQGLKDVDEAVRAAAQAGLSLLATSKPGTKE